MDAKYKFEFTVMASGLFMLLTVYEMPVATYFKSVVYYRCFQGVAAQLLMPLILQILIPTYSDDDGSALFWILDIVEYFMYCITIFLIKRVITSLRVL
ncbi:uncharacterized protein LOC112691759 isoform X2 [Sipha flava]|uniref:Uncharacterized protein LOC112691759 isoform X2 n=1 Tax=Sipha flava TaxID=143950 RepID=A0A8B8GGD1_9HEMI|nr:uncharacterized protein LOC112691759 isoform X2 [Sipha flava]